MRIDLDQIDRESLTDEESAPFNTACVLDLTPSFNRMLDTWFLTVPSVVPNASAISRLL